jgi:hypothetical protein
MAVVAAFLAIILYAHRQHTRVKGEIMGIFKERPGMALTPKTLSLLISQNRWQRAVDKGDAQGKWAFGRGPRPAISSFAPRMGMIEAALEDFRRQHLAWPQKETSDFDSKQLWEFANIFF